MKAIGCIFMKLQSTVRTQFPPTWDVPKFDFHGGPEYAKEYSYDCLMNLLLDYGRIISNQISLEIK